MKQSWKLVPIFISSTFNDMHAERDYLVKSVFPELREWCEARNLKLADIDLRWGVTKEDSDSNNTVRKCLENIEDCRPFFLCLLGQRRGWVPGKQDISKETTDEYPQVGEYVDKYSVTEMEIEHALLAPMYRIINGEKKPLGRECRAVFFERLPNWIPRDFDKEHRKLFLNDAVADRGGSPAAEDAALEKTKAKIRKVCNKKSGEMLSYSCRFDPTRISPELAREDNGEVLQKGRLVDFTSDKKPLKEVILKKLKAMILLEYPDREHPLSVGKNAFELDLLNQDQFVYNAAAGYIERLDVEKQIENYLKNNDRRPLLLTASSGYGKTTLLANLVLTEDKKRIFRFCGVSDYTTDLLSLWRSICTQAKVEAPQTSDELGQNIARILEDLHNAGINCVLIDAIDQMQNGRDLLSLVPEKLPEGFKLIVSCKANSDELRNYNFLRIILSELSDINAKKSLIENFLHPYLKSLSKEQLKLITNSETSKNPLFLKILLHELRFFGSYKQLGDEIRRYGNSIIDAFRTMLERLEHENGYDIIAAKESIPLLFGWLSQARNGLSEGELCALFAQKYPSENDRRFLSTIRYFLRQTRSFMTKRMGRIDFLYSSFKEAAATKYTHNKEQLNAELAKCFKNLCDPRGNGSFDVPNARALTELPYHLSQFYKDEHDRIYGSLLYLDARCSNTDIVVLLEEMAGIPSCEKARQMILRYKTNLTLYKNSYISLFYFYATKEGKSQIIEMNENGIITKPWIKADVLLERRVTRTSDLRDSCAVIIEKPLQTPTAYCLSLDGTAALISRAEKGIFIDTNSMEEYTGVLYPGFTISTAALSKSGNFAAVCDEDGNGKIFRVTYTKTTVDTSFIGDFKTALTEDGRGIFTFEGDSCFWYADSDGDISRYKIIEKKTENFPAKGEITSICAGKNYCVFTCWQRKAMTITSVSIKDGSKYSERIFERDDIAVMAVDPEDNFLLSSSDNKNGYYNGIVNERLEDIYTVLEPHPTLCATFSSVKTALLFPQSLTKKNNSIMDGINKETRPVNCNIRHARNVQIEKNADDNFTFISAVSIVKFNVSGKSVDNGDYIIDAVLKYGVLYALQKNVDGNFFLFANDREYYLTADAVTLGGKIHVFGDYLRVSCGIKAYVSHLSDTGFPEEFKECPTAINIPSESRTWIVHDNGIVTKAGKLSGLDALNNLNYGKYYSFPGYVALTGCLQGDNPYALYLYEDKQANYFSKSVERYFNIKRGLIDDVSYCEDSETLYLLFAGAENSFENPSVAYGSIRDFQNKGEKYCTLDCPKLELSSGAGSQGYAVCSNGIVFVFDNENMIYNTSLFLDKRIRFVKGSDQENVYIAVLGDTKIIMLSIMK